MYSLRFNRWVRTIRRLQDACLKQKKQKNPGHLMKAVQHYCSSVGSYSCFCGSTFITKYCYLYRFSTEIMVTKLMAVKFYISGYYVCSDIKALMVQLTDDDLTAFQTPCCKTMMRH